MKRIVVYLETAEVGMMIVVTSRFQSLRRSQGSAPGLSNVQRSSYEAQSHKGC